MERLLFVQFGVLSLISVILSTAHGQRPVETIPQDQTVLQGQQANFSCSIGDNPNNRQLQWSIDDNTPNTPYRPIFVSPNEWIEVQGRPYGTEKYGIEGTYNLVVKNAQARTDGVEYLCQTPEHVNQKVANLVVIDQFDVSIDTMGTLAIGNTVTLRCRLGYGAPPQATLSNEQQPQVTMYIGNRMIGGRGRAGRIEIQPPNPNNPRDNYHMQTLTVNYSIAYGDQTRMIRCNVSSLAYSASAIEEFPVQYPPGISENQFNEEYDNEQNVSCVGTGNPVPTMTWTPVSGYPQGSTAIVGTPRSGVVYMIVRYTGMDQTWECSANNVVGKANKTVVFKVNKETEQEIEAEDRRVALGVGLGIGLGVPILIGIIVLVCLLMRNKNRSAGAKPYVESNGAKINNEHRPPRPVSGTQTGPSPVNPNPAPGYMPPVYNEQVQRAPGRTTPDRAGFGDLGVANIHAGGSTPSLNRSFEGGGEGSIHAPNTSV